MTAQYYPLYNAVKCSKNNRPSATRTRVIYKKAKKLCLLYGSRQFFLNIMFAVWEPPQISILF